MRLLVKNGRIITATDDYVADILVDGEAIALIGRSLDTAADTVIDASGRYVLPGGVDPHVHLENPSGETATVDTFTTGTAAAAAGGTTTVIDFMTQRRGESFDAAIDRRMAQLERNRPVVDVGLHMIITDLSGANAGRIPWLVDQGISSFKMYMAYPARLMVDDTTVFGALSEAADCGGLVMMHAENGSAIDVLVARALAAGKTGPKYHASTRPTLAEAEATHRATMLAEMAGAPIYFVHLSCEEALEHVANAHRRGRPVYAETCPQYLFLDDSVYDLPGFEAAKYVFTPPARPKHHQDALWRGLSYHDLSVISTDHCPFCFKGQKEIGRDDFSKIPNGGPGIEHRLMMVHNGGVRSGRITLNRMVEVLSTAPAKLFGLFPRKGTIAVGSDGDLVIFDPNVRKTLSAATHNSLIDYTPYEGVEVTGAPEVVVSRGTVVYRDDRVVGAAGHGRFIRRAPHLQRL
ncbi:MAG: dihydropyrimidinase [Chloroflexota bacterium]